MNVLSYKEKEINNGSPGSRLHIYFKYENNIRASFWFIYDMFSKTYELRFSDLFLLGKTFTVEDIEILKKHAQEVFAKEFNEAISFYDKGHAYLSGDNFKLEEFDFLVVPGEPSSGVKYVFYTKDEDAGIQLQLSYRREEVLNNFCVRDLNSADNGYAIYYSHDEGYPYFEKVNNIGKKIIAKSKNRLRILF